MFQNSKLLRYCIGNFSKYCTNKKGNFLCIGDFLLQKAVLFPDYCQWMEVFGSSMALFSFVCALNATIFSSKVGTRVLTRLCGRLLNIRRVNTHQLPSSIIVVMARKVFFSLSSRSSLINVTGLTF